MLEITVHRPDADDFSGSGLGYLRPLDCTVSETLNGMYELEITMSLNDPMSALIGMGSVIVAPVPAAETPELALTAASAQTTQRLIYKVRTNGSNLHLRSGPGTSHKILRKYKNGTEIVVLDRSNSSWYRVAAPDGAGGWMSANWLSYVRTETVASSGGAQTETVAPKPVRAQPFRVHKIVPGLLTASFSARHIFYDLSDNLVLPRKLTGTRQAIARALLANCMDGGHGFNAYCGGADSGTLELDEPTNPVEAIAGTDGLIDTMGGELMRDWYDLYIVDRLGRNRGVSVRYGRNLISVGGSVCSDNAATRIVPIGQNKEGDDLYLPEKTVEAEDADEWPHPRYAVLRVDDAKVGDGMTQAQAFARMRAAAKEAFDQGAALSDASITVDFVELAQTVDATDAAKLQKLFLGDDVLVEITPMGMRAAMRMVSYIYDCLREQYREMTLGSAGADIASVGISPRQLPDAGITASKLANAAVQARNLGDGAVGSAKIAMAAIGIAHINQAAIDQLNANAIAAVRADIHELAAGSVTADQLYADLAILAAAQITTANIQNASIDWAEIAALNAQAAAIAKAQITTANIESAGIDWAQIGTLTAQIASIAEARIGGATITSAQISDLQTVLASAVSAEIASADIGFAQVKDLAAGTAIITQGVGGELYIARLAVTEANLVSLTVGELVVKGADGHFYSVSVDESGNVVTALKQIGNGDVADASINAGEKIIEGTITAATLNAQDIFANSAVIRQLIAANLDVGTLFAREAFIAQLNTSDIRGNTYLKITVDGLADDIAAAQAAADAAQTKANQNAADMAGIVTSLNGDIANLQSQIDGSIMTWFYPVPPTAATPPASDWTTDDLKNVHLGDLYYDTITGYCYRWQVLNNAYSWQRITDTDVTKALSDAAKAQDTADAKRRVFTATPVPPYDAGDLWAQGSGGDILRCQTGKAAGQSYAASDWVPASKYTDDTAANAAQGTADANAERIASLTTRVGNAEISLDAANAAILLRATQTEVAQQIAAVQGAADDAQDAADAAQSAADAANTAAGNAQSTANAAQTAAGANADSIAALTTRVNTAEVAIDAANAEITLKASKTEVAEAVDGIEARVTAAESALLALTEEAIIATVMSSEQYAEDQDNLALSVDAALGFAEQVDQRAEAAAALAQEALEGSSAAADAIQTLRTTVTQTADGLDVVVSRTTDVEGRVQALESGVHIGPDGIGIYKEGSPFKNTMTNDGWRITENDSPIITCAETKLTAPRVQVTDAFLIGSSAWKPGSDGHLRLLKYGR